MYSPLVTDRIHANRYISRQPSLLRFGFPRATTPIGARFDRTKTASVHPASGSARSQAREASSARRPAIHARPDSCEQRAAQATSNPRSRLPRMSQPTAATRRSRPTAREPPSMLSYSFRLILAFFSTELSFTISTSTENTAASRGSSSA